MSVKFKDTTRMGDARYVVRERSGTGWSDVSSHHSLKRAEQEVERLLPSGVQLAIVKRREVGLTRTH